MKNMKMHFSCHKPCFLMWWLNYAIETKSYNAEVIHSLFYKENVQHLTDHWDIFFVIIDFIKHKVVPQLYSPNGHPGKSGLGIFIYGSIKHGQICRYSSKLFNMTALSNELVLYFTCGFGSWVPIYVFPWNRIL